MTATRSAVSPVDPVPQIERNFDAHRAVYLDLRDWINLAKVVKHQRAPVGYPELLAAARQARKAKTALFPLSGTHYMEMSGIADPSQRRDVAAVMAELSEFHVLLGRPTIMRLEMDAALDQLQGVATDSRTVPLLGRSVGWAFGVHGGLKVFDGDGADITSESQGEDWYAAASWEFERRALEGPSDREAELLRRTSNYRPETAWETAERRAEQEREFADRLSANLVWRRGRLRDLVSARELAAEWIDALTEALMARGTTVGGLFGQDRETIRAFADGMPSNRIAISIKTAYHRDGGHRWLVNDIHDIDALSIAVPYCDAVLTDKAARNALVSAKVDRDLGTFMPRTPLELAAWLRGVATGPEQSGD